MTVRVLAVGNQNTDQVDHRSLITALTQTAGNIVHRGGFFPSSPTPGVLNNVSAMVVSVGPFKAVLPNQSGPGQFLVQSDEAEELTFDAGEPSITRIDRIIVRVYNSSQDGSSDDEAYVEYLKGQASGSATAVPNGGLLMWEIPVPPGASSGSGGINFTSIANDKKVYTTASGGVIPVIDNGELESIPNPFEGMSAYVKGTDILYIHNGTSFRPHGQINVASSANLNTILNPFDGTVAVTRDTGSVYIHDGTTWRKYSRVLSGTLNISFSPADNSHNTANIPFGETLPTTPVVVTNINSAPNSTTKFVSRAINIGPSDFDLFVFSGDDSAQTWSSVSCSWIAVV